MTLNLLCSGCKLQAISVLLSLFLSSRPGSTTTLPQEVVAISVDQPLSKLSLQKTSSGLLRTRRSPFIVAFQVTRPPGLFQVSLRKPVIMGVMSNMTSMLLGSELARMLSRGLTGQQQQLLLPFNVSSARGNLTRNIF